VNAICRAVARVQVTARMIAESDDIRLMGIEEKQVTETVHFDIHIPKLPLQ
jgi:hypothetical protein